MKKILVILLILIVITAYIIKSNNNLKLSNTDDLGTFISLYSGWIFNIFTNIKDVTTYAIQKQWVPENSRNSTNTS